MGQGLIGSYDEVPQEGGGGLETRGDLLIRGLRESQNDAIIGVRFGDLDADVYRKEPMENLLDRWRKEKKYKHSKHCHKQRKHFSPFVFSVDCMLRK